MGRDVKKANRHMNNLGKKSKRGKVSSPFLQVANYSPREERLSKGGKRPASRVGGVSFHRSLAPPAKRGRSRMPSRKRNQSTRGQGRSSARRKSKRGSALAARKRNPHNPYFRKARA